MAAVPPAIQYCPNCRRAIALGLFQCPFCSIRLAPGFGAIPAIGPGNLGGTASAARTCGILSLILTLCPSVLAYGLNYSERNKIAGLLIIAFIAGIVLAILAVVKGNGTKRILANYPLNPNLRGKANAGIVTGWITIGFVVLSIIAYSGQ